MIERIDQTTPEADTRGHRARYHLAAGLCLQGDYVIDAACGTGYGAEILNPRGDLHYIGVDRELAVVGLARPSEHFERADLEEWAPVVPFDVGVGFETIEHLEDFSTYVEWLKQARRWIIVSAPIKPTKAVNPYHRHDFKRGDLARIFGLEPFAVFDQPGERSEVVIFRCA